MQSERQRSTRARWPVGLWPWLAVAALAVVIVSGVELTSPTTRPVPSALASNLTSTQARACRGQHLTSRSRTSSASLCPCARSAAMS